MRTLMKHSLRGLAIAGAVVFSAVGGVTPIQAMGGGPISGGQIALSGGLDVGGGVQGRTPPSSTQSTSNAVSQHRRHARRIAPR